MSTAASHAELIDTIQRYAEDPDETQTDVQRREVMELAHDLQRFDIYTPEQRAEMSAKLIGAMTAFWRFRERTFMGYQTAQGLGGTKERLGALLDMHLNNVGDPYHDNSGLRMNCKVAERAVMAYYGLLFSGAEEAGASIQPGTGKAQRSPQDVVRRRNATAGYVTCMGSTEGNTYMLRQARDYLKGRFLFPEYADVPAAGPCTCGRLPLAEEHEPIILYSTSTHYSINKIKDLLVIDTPRTFMERKGDGTRPRDHFTEAECGELFPDNAWPDKLPTYEDGTIHLDALRLLVGFFFARGNPVIVLCNYGTTFTGAHDDPEEVTRVVRSQKGVAEETRIERAKDDGSEEKQVLYTRRNYFIACDGALGAAYGAHWEAANKAETNAALQQYLRMAEAAAQGAYPYVDLIRALGTERDFDLVAPSDVVLPTFNFRLADGVMAVSMSSHKFIGAPIPGGLVLTVEKYMLDFTAGGVSYIGSLDTSISGSRSGLNVMLLYDYISRHSHAMQVAKYYGLLNLARFAARHISAEALDGAVVEVARDKPDAVLTPYERELRFGCGATRVAGPAVFNFAGSLSVIFPRPSDWIVDKYSLSCDTVRVPREEYAFDEDFLSSAEGQHYLPAKKRTDTHYELNCAHIFTLHHVTTEMIRSLAADLKADKTIQCIKRAMGRACSAHFCASASNVN